MKPGRKHELKPKLRFPEFRNAPHWTEKLLEDALSPIVRERKKPIEAYTGLGMRSHGKGTFLKNLQNPEKNSMEYLYEVQGDDLIVNITFAWEGAIAIAKPTDTGALVSHRFPTYEFKRDSAIPDFFRYIILDKQFVYYLGVISPGGAGRNRVLNKSDFLKLRVFLPEVSEQKKIAECLTALDEVMAAHGQKLDALKTHKTGLMQQLFPRAGETVPRLRFPEFQDTEEWEAMRLGDVCEKIMDGTHFSPKTKSGPRLYLTSKNIQNGRIDLSNTSYISEEEHRQIYNRCPVKLHDVLLTKDGANTGNCALNDLNFEFSLLSSVAVLRGMPSMLGQRFLYQSILSEKNQELIAESMSGQAITRITLEKIGNFIVTVASIEEQERIADCLSAFDEIIFTQTQKLEALKTHKKGLMQQLFPSPAEVES